jgi:hypothetical protein
MGRAFLTIVVPLFLPTALYVGWRYALGRGINPPASWLWLALAGLVLASLTFIAASIDFDQPRDGIYVPPHVEGGKVIPGHVEPAPSGR